jgi:hypothetical protein
MAQVGFKKLKYNLKIKLVEVALWRRFLMIASILYQFKVKAKAKLYFFSGYVHP